MDKDRMIEFLWDIIDDIDTYSDRAEYDDQRYRQLVQRRIQDRWKTGISTNGYELYIPKRDVDSALLAWACERWYAEVFQRPLTNIHRRSLDDTWRQVIRYAGSDPKALLGPSHDELVDAMNKSIHHDIVCSYWPKDLED